MSPVAAAKLTAGADFPRIVASADAGAGAGAASAANATRWSAEDAAKRLEVLRLSHALDSLLQRSERQRLAARSFGSWRHCAERARQQRSEAFFDAMGWQLRSAKRRSDLLLTERCENLGPALLKPGRGIQLGAKLGHGRTELSLRPLLLMAPPALLPYAVLAAWQSQVAQARRRGRWFQAVRQNLDGRERREGRSTLIFALRSWGSWASASARGREGADRVEATERPASPGTPCSSWSGCYDRVLACGKSGSPTSCTSPRETAGFSLQIMPSGGVSLDSGFQTPHSNVAECVTLAEVERDRSGGAGTAATAEGTVCDSRDRFGGAGRAGTAEGKVCDSTSHSDHGRVDKVVDVTQEVLRGRVAEAGITDASDNLVDTSEPESAPSFQVVPSVHFSRRAPPPTPAAPACSSRVLPPSMPTTGPGLVKPAPAAHGERLSQAVPVGRVHGERKEDPTPCRANTPATPATGSATPTMPGVVRPRPTTVTIPGRVLPWEKGVAGGNVAGGLQSPSSAQSSGANPSGAASPTAQECQRRRELSPQRGQGVNGHGPPPCWADIDAAHGGAEGGAASVGYPGAQRPAAKRGPERFYYDTASYTGIARFGPGREGPERKASGVRRGGVPAGPVADQPVPLQVQVQVQQSSASEQRQCSPLMRRQSSPFVRPPSPSSQQPRAARRFSTGGDCSPRNTSPPSQAGGCTFVASSSTAKDSAAECKDDNQN
ncbi:unnamed protein product [Polarella glacialis]|uniref:Uncharacterized protein n=1 Tax=Polarella glacialis TaxID=89957 RepID=A0A813DK77_POLGL|nr:unnamed protein product [Polarella glacialis]